MSQQTNNLAVSLPKLKALWNKAGEALGSCDFVCVRFMCSPAEFAGKPEQVIVITDKNTGAPVQFPSLTAALRYNADSLKARGFTRATKAGQGIMSEAGHWGVWQVSAIKDKAGKFFPNPGGSLVMFQTVLPVPKAKPQESEPIVPAKAEAKPAVAKARKPKEVPALAPAVETAPPAEVPAGEPQSE